MSVTNTGPKNIDRYNIQSWHTLMKETNAFAQRVVAEPYTLARQILPRLPTFLKDLPSHITARYNAMSALHDTTFEAFRAVLVRTPVV